MPTVGLYRKLGIGQADWTGQFSTRSSVSMPGTPLSILGLPRSLLLVILLCGFTFSIVAHVKALSRISDIVCTLRVYFLEASSQTRPKVVNNYQRQQVVTFKNKVMQRLSLSLGTSLLVI